MSHSRSRAAAKAKFLIVSSVQTSACHTCSFSLQIRFRVLISCFIYMNKQSYFFFFFSCLWNSLMAGCSCSLVMHLSCSIFHLSHHLMPRSLWSKGAIYFPFQRATNPAGRFLSIPPQSQTNTQTNRQNFSLIDTAALLRPRLWVCLMVSANTYTCSPTSLPNLTSDLWLWLWLEQQQRHWTS